MDIKMDVYHKIIIIGFSDDGSAKWMIPFEIFRGCPFKMVLKHPLSLSSFSEPSLCSRGAKEGGGFNRIN